MPRRTATFWQERLQGSADLASAAPITQKPKPPHSHLRPRGDIAVGVIHDRVAETIRVVQFRSSSKAGTNSRLSCNPATRPHVILRDAAHTLLPALQLQKSRPSSRRKRASTMLCTSEAPSTMRAARA
jgi:hypothetical protein